VYLPEDADDVTLVGRVLAGDTAAFEVLVRRHQRVLFTVALRMLGDREEAQDAAQSAFVKAYEKLGSFNANYRFFSWIYRIVVNECLNVRRARPPAAEPGTFEPVAPGEALELLEAQDRRRIVQGAILALPNDYRQVIVLRHFTELSYGEISTALGIPVKTVKSRLYTARQRLAELLTGAGPNRGDRYR
jgi:RNA polymerase sigma-70 factor, ECF subfamily